MKKCRNDCLLQSWSLGPLGTAGSALKACGMDAGWRGVPWNALRGHCNALPLLRITSPELGTHLNKSVSIRYETSVCTCRCERDGRCRRGGSPSESSSQLQEVTMEQSLDEAWPWGHDASSMSSPLSLQTRRTAGWPPENVNKQHRVQTHILQIKSLLTSRPTRIYHLS